jgi:hypothetical protein
VRVFTRESAAGAWVERTPRSDGVTVSDHVNERSTASVVLLDSSGTLHFSRGVGVRVTNDQGEPLFTGFVDTATESRLGLGGVREHQLECVDLHYLADKRLIARGYTNETADDIVRSILADYLEPEGVTEGRVEPASLVRGVTFNYVPVADALTTLAQRQGFWWRITPAGELDFAPPLPTQEPFTVDATVVRASNGVFTTDSEDYPVLTPALDLEDLALAGTLVVQRHGHSYRNRQWVKGGRDRTDPQVEVQVGDGERRVFVVGFPIAEEPSVEVDRGSGFVAETVGAAGISTGKQWVFSFGSTSLTQDESGSVLSAAHRVRVSYVGLFDVIARVEDGALQSAQALLEGGTGVVERVAFDRTSESRLQAFQYAGDLLEYYGRGNTVVRFATRELVFEPGVTERVSCASFGLVNQEALCVSVERFSVGGEERLVATLVVGPVEGSWAQWFATVSRRLDTLGAVGGSEVEVVTLLEEFQKLWVDSERPNLFFEEFPSSGLFPSADLVPAFEHPDRVKYLSWYSGTTEVGRKAFTAQTGASSSEIVTTTVLGVNDAVGSFTHFGWWGGAGATDEFGSGVLVDKQAFSFTKTDVEQIQVVKTDTKW